MVYYLTRLPGKCSELSFAKACYLMARGAPLVYKMYSIHIVMATYQILSTINGPLFIYLYFHPEVDTLGDWRDRWMLLNLGCGAVSTIFFLVLNGLNVSLYNMHRSRIVALPEGSCEDTIYRVEVFHYFWVAPCAMLVTPIMNTAGCMAEWIAAIKTAKSHKFEYEVALKPQAAARR